LYGLLCFPLLLIITYQQYSSAPAPNLCRHSSSYLRVLLLSPLHYLLISKTHLLVGGCRIQAPPNQLCRPSIAVPSTNRASFQLASPPCRLFLPPYYYHHYSRSDRLSTRFASASRTNHRHSHLVGLLLLQQRIATTRPLLPSVLSFLSYSFSPSSLFKSIIRSVAVLTSLTHPDYRIRLHALLISTVARHFSAVPAGS